MAYDPSRDSCANCIHFTQDVVDEEIGECHRYPSTYIQRQHIWSFAVVTANNTCGEFAATLPPIEEYDPKNRH